MRHPLQNSAAVDRVAVGFIARPKGVHGEVKIEPLTHSLDRFDQLQQVVLRREGQPDQTFALEYWRPQHPGVLMKFAGVDTIDEARRLLISRYITVAATDVPSLPEDVYYVYELEGCRVEDEQGRPLGRLEEVLHMPSTDVYVVRDEEREILVPAVADFLVEVDPAQSRVVVKGIENLLP